MTFLERQKGQTLKCVVVGRLKRGCSEREKTHFVLIITPKATKGSGSSKVYERVGVGFHARQMHYAGRQGVGREDSLGQVFLGYYLV